MLSSIFLLKDFNGIISFAASTILRCLAVCFAVVANMAFVGVDLAKSPQPPFERSWSLPKVF